jgi:hypothetical protein
LVLSAAFSLSAHHSTAPFDMTNLGSKVHGRVVEFLWANPHSYIVVDETSNGSTRRWKLEAEALNLLRRNGWTKDSLKPGDEITCLGARAKDPQMPTMKCFTVLFQDGSKLEATPMGVSGKQPRDLR